MHGFKNIIARTAWRVFTGQRRRIYNSYRPIYRCRHINSTRLRRDLNIKNIIFKIKNEFDIEYEDVTYKDLYIKTIQFAKEVDEILSAEITQVDNIFHSTPDFNSFKNDKLV